MSRELTREGPPLSVSGLLDMALLIWSSAASFCVSSNPWMLRLLAFLVTP